MPHLREEVVGMLRDELVGPSRHLPGVQTGLHVPELKNEEILRAEDPPRVRYGAGILFPGGARVQAQEDVRSGEFPDRPQLATDVAEAASRGDNLEDVPAAVNADSANLVDSATDLEVNRANEYLPSALGLTALIRVPQQITIVVSAATYERTEMKGRGWKRKDGSDGGGYGWWRRPIAASVEFTSAEVLTVPQAIVEKEVPGVEGLVVHLFARRSSVGSAESTERIVTVTLINRRTCAGERADDEECFYQCAIRVDGGEGSACIREYPEIPPGPADDPEELSLRLLYGHRRAFGVGHGCDADWDDIEADARDWIRSESLPEYEIKPIVPTRLAGIDLSMLRLSEREGLHAAGIAQRLADAYLEWITSQEATLEADTTLPELLKVTGRRHLRACHTCQQRIAQGAHLLATNGQVRHAFVLMNRAMLMQQIHYRLSSEHPRRWVVPSNTRHGLEPELPYAAPSYQDPSHVWRPFQLAFILMNLRSMAEPRSADRGVVDVIWFPTGGGKTEAYLGLAAYTILLRRLRNPANVGTTVLMRYTLRLLTTQQFQRAASLICALEMLRREMSDELGSATVSIGLWVGSDVTPNSEADALAKLRALQRGDGENPFVFRSCPWCGMEMGPVRVGRATRIKGYCELPAPKRVRLVCEDPSCPFRDGEGLPVEVVDEHLYAAPPTLLIGTVDKFALIPWLPSCRAFFSLGTGGGTAPPELIIQDELHLISGPLGSMVGHYETLIDILCRGANDTPAKLVASTATIARSTDQILSLYARQYSELFPPQGLRAGDSFFAHEDADRPGRLYVGVFASGSPSHVTTQIRVLSCLLQAPKSLISGDDSALDRYWTLMVYFNAIRELGHAATLIRADIVEYMAAMWERMGLSRNYLVPDMPDRRRFINRDLELTSRVSSSDVTDVMNDLFIRIGTKKDRPVDVCLATNMVQVGLDVPRLNLMAIVGQPKTTSEYIQASSRVGRDTPGLVVTILNPSKPRDRSHYEHFRSFHQSIYRFVEPTSVTPFALPVRERALHALVISLVRLWGDDSVRRAPDPPPTDKLIERIRGVILDRVRLVDGVELNAAARSFDDFVAEWRRVPPTRYGGFGQPREEVPLMFPAGSQELADWDGRAWPTPSSMRNVDATCNAQPISSYPGV